MAAIRPARVLGSLVIGLALFGIWSAAHAIDVALHGGNRALGGAFHYPGWATGHFIGALVFVVILPFQLWPRLRARRPGAHRMAGYTAAASAVMFATTGLAMPFVMPARPFFERTFMLTVGLAFLFMLGKGILAARRRDIATHRRWMLRVTALALGPVTQRVIFPFFAAAGIDSLPRFWDLFGTSLWLSAVVNLVVIEWWIEMGVRRAATWRPADESGRAA